MFSSTVLEEVALSSELLANAIGLSKDSPCGLGALGILLPVAIFGTLPLWLTLTVTVLFLGKAFILFNNVWTWLIALETFTLTVFSLILVLL